VTYGVQVRLEFSVNLYKFIKGVGRGMVYPWAIENIALLEGAVWHLDPELEQEA
jgi:hypothetical protein